MLSASDLLRSQQKLEARSKEVLEKARLKAEKERLLAERQAAREAARNHQARQRRLAQLAAEEEVGAVQRCDASICVVRVCISNHPHQTAAILIGRVG